MIMINKNYDDDNDDGDLALKSCSTTPVFFLKTPKKICCLDLCKKPHCIGTLPVSNSQTGYYFQQLCGISQC